MSKLKQKLKADNVERVAKALTSLYPYQCGDDDIDETTVTDLLVDLRHFSDAHGIDFHKALKLSYQHYLEEKG